MRRKLQTKRGRQRYALRMETVEPVFGQIKQGRGFRQFLLRGLAKVRAEWSLICTGHNLLKLFRSGRQADGAGGPAGIVPHRLGAGKYRVCQQHQLSPPRLPLPQIPDPQAGC